MNITKLVVEGWRFIPHSYAIVHQWQCLALLRRPEIALKVRDLPYVVPQWQAVTGLFSPEEEAALRALPLAEPGETATATLRIGFPYDYTPAAGPTWVFGTSEYGRVPAGFITGGLAALRDSTVGLITPSHWSRRGFLASGVDAERVTVVPHGIDPALFRPRPERRDEMRGRLNLNGFTFLSVGAMSPNKGMDLLLRAFAAVLDRHPETRLVLKGTDALYQSSSLMKQYLGDLPAADQQKVLNRLSYIGNTMSMQQMSDLYQCADAYVSPYRAEAFNMPVLEAAACGLPILCTDGGPTDDFTAADFTLRIEARLRPTPVEDMLGETLEPSLEHLTACMLKAIEDEAWRQGARDTSWRFVHDNFTWDKVVDRLLSVMGG